ncbi:Calx-beta domain-containing protein [Geitlerinema sp. CS-897]|nr:Calx-beta domain-containing protein [Geitlerinema sp. CS-897]
MANITGTLVPDLIIPGGNIQGELLPDLSGDDIIDSRDGDDAVAADAGNDSVVGGLGDDQLFGNAGNDTMRGDAGLDSLYGGRDDDLLYGDDGNDLVFADLGNDTGYGGAGDDLMTGNKGEDALYGGDGNDSIFGGQDNDSIFGEAGDDLLLGDLGADTLEGGAGNDIFVMSRRDATLTTGGPTVDDADLIKDFVKGEDKFMLDGLQFTDLNIQVDADGNSTIQDSQTSQFLAKVEGVSDLDVTDFTGVTTDPGPQGAFQFSQAAYTGVEGTDAANPGKALITVTRTDGSQDPVSVGYKVTPGVTNPALAGGIDFFETTDGLLTFAAGETEKTFEVLLPADPGTTNVADDGKTVSLTLFNPTNGAVLGSQSAAVLTIGDSAGSGGAVGGAEYEFVLDSVAGASTNVYGVAESDGGTALGTFTTPITIKRSITVGEDTINFNAFDATATSPDDFLRIDNQTVTFADGQQFATVDVTIVNDGTAVPELADIENASLTLQNGSGQVLDSANLLINNQAAVATGAGFSFGTSDFAVGSGGVSTGSTFASTNIDPSTGDVRFAVDVFRSDVSAAESVNFTVQAAAGSGATPDTTLPSFDGTSAGVDFLAFSGQIDFAVGEASKTINVPVGFDGVGSEFMQIVLDPTATLGSFPTADVDII